MSCAHATTETVRTVHDFCLIGAPITFSERHGTQVETAANSYDSDETVKQVKDHDLKWETTCPTKPEEKPQ
jgi:hypothetical protein